MSPSRLFLFSCLLVLAPTASADIFSYTDANGTVHFSNVPDSTRYRLFMRTPKERAPVLVESRWRGGAIMANRKVYAPLVEDAASKNQLDAALIHAVIAQESGYNPRAVSNKGAGGLMQLMPDTARRYGVTDLFDPAQNIQAGSHYLKDLLAMFNQDIKLALAAYNAGENAVIRHGNRIPPYRETTAYVPNVLNRYQKYRASAQ